MSYELKGRLQKVYDTQTFSSGFQKRVFVVNTGGDYPQEVPFSLLKDKVDNVKPSDVGADVEVSFDIRGNEYNGKHYCDIVAWKVVKSANSSGMDSGNGTAKSKDDSPF
jgi:single-strand DNA-binding protein